MYTTTAQHSTARSVNLDGLGADHLLDGVLDVLLGQLLPGELVPQPPELLHREEAVVEGVLRAHGGDPLAEKLDETERSHLYFDTTI